MIEVADTGPGLDGRVLFGDAGGGATSGRRPAPYRRGVPGSTPPADGGRGGGGGGGIAICGRLAALMGGGVRLRDRPDTAGAIFTLALPWGPESMATAAGAAAADRAGAVDAPVGALAPGASNPAPQAGQSVPTPVASRVSDDAARASRHEVMPKAAPAQGSDSA